MTRLAPALAALLLTAPLAATPALAQEATETPLSQILSEIEAEPGFERFDEIDWDDDGHWDIEYEANGEEVEIEVDAATGERRDD